MATSLDLLRIAFAAHDNHQRALAHRKRSKKREMWLNGARRCVRELTDWVMSVDGKWRNRHGGVREGSTPARVAKDLVQDMFYDCPGAWYGNITPLLRADDPWGCITVNAEKVAAAKKFLRQYVRVTGQKASRHDGGILLRLRPRKKTRQLLAKGVRRLEVEENRLGLQALRGPEKAGVISCPRPAGPTQPLEKTMTNERTVHDAQVERYARLKFPFYVCAVAKPDAPIAGFRGKVVAEAFILGLRNPDDWFVSVPENYEPPAGPGGKQD